MPSESERGPFEIEKRVLLGVSAVVIAALLIPWPRADAGQPAETIICIDPPPVIEVAPQPPHPPRVEEPPQSELPAFDVPEPLPPDVEVPVEPTPEPMPEQLAPAASGPNVGDRPRQPPRKAPSPVREGLAGLKKPRLLHAPTPEYPAAARVVGCKGTVIVEARIGTDGRVLETRLLRAPRNCPGLAEAALEAVAGRLYRPGELQGRPLEVLATIRVGFELN